MKKQSYLKTMVCSFLLLFCSYSIYGKAVNKELIRIETNNTTLLYIVENGNVNNYYFGAKLKNPEDYLNYTGNPQGALFPAFAGKSAIEAPVSVIHSNGVLSTEFISVGHSSKAIDSNVSITTIVLKDKVFDFYATLFFKAFKNEDIIETWVDYKNDESELVTLKNFASAYIPVKSDKYFLTKFHGSWFGEMKMEEEQLTHGISTLQSIQGVRTSHNFNPSFIVSLNQPASEDFGEVIGGSLAWSGSWKMTFENDIESRLNIVAGINNYASEWPLKNGEEFQGCHFVFTYSNAGTGQMTRNFHSWSRKYAIQDGNELRPVVLNSWEGNFFDFDESKIIKMIKDGAKMGIEMFVLDDGWFGGNKYQRDNDGMALGDWDVNKKRFPNGLDKVIEEAKKNKIKFGIWVEPEMVNRQSELYEVHPDWVLKEPGREQYTERNNYVLDLTNPEVVNFVFESVSKVIRQNPYISYVKMDSNSPIYNPYALYLDKNSQQQLWYLYMKNLYSVLDSLVKTFPDITFQVCSSGGGRVDYGSLPYFHEFWASDNTDALQRVYIQNGTSYFYPSIAMGAHVAKVPNGITQRITPLKYRFDVAMSGRFGIELLPADLTTDELTFAKAAVQTYKDIRPIVQLGNLYRLLSPYQGCLASLMYVNDAKSKAVVFVYQTQRMFGDFYPNIKPKGLDPLKKYKVTEINVLPEQAKKFTTEESVFGGDFLMKNGLPCVYWGKQGPLSINLMGEFASAVFLIEEMP